jgi:hypothetical protein
MLSAQYQKKTHSLAIGVVKGLELHDIRMSDNAHNLQLTVLPLVNIAQL